MDELISRQAVKELAHNQVREKYCGAALKEHRDFYIKLADSIIDLLPSAQPEPPEECERCMMEHTDEMEKLEAELAMAQPHWIPVTENCDCDLMDNEEVLVFQKDGTINGQIRHAMFYDFNGKKKFVTWEEGITIYNVLAYMPLPEPYKEVTE